MMFLCFQTDHATKLLDFYRLYKFANTPHSIICLLICLLILSSCHVFCFSLTPTPHNTSTCCVHFHTHSHTCVHIRTCTIQPYSVVLILSVSLPEKLTSSTPCSRFHSGSQLPPLGSLPWLVVCFHSTMCIPLLNYLSNFCISSSGL